MSSRSLLAARSRRAGENAPPVSGNRPVTSIGSTAQSQGYPQPPSNVRVSKSQQPQQPPNNAYKQVQQSQQQSQTALPFTKLSISDAIGLITLRLGRVEQWIIETDHENKDGSTTSLPENSRIIDNSILSSIVNRLEAVEKNSLSSSVGVPSEQITELSNTVATFNEQLTRIGDAANKHTLEISKNTEQVFRFNRELTETKDILKTFMIKYDLFTTETNEKFTDYEVALAELEQNIQKPGEPIKESAEENIALEIVEEIVSSDMSVEM